MVKEKLLSMKSKKGIAELIVWVYQQPELKDFNWSSDNMERIKVEQGSFAADIALAKKLINRYIKEKLCQ